MPLQIMEMGAGTLTVGESGTLTDLAIQTKSVKLTPDVDAGKPIHVLSGDTAPGDRTEEWKLEGTFQQDFGFKDSVIEFCFTNRGKTLPFEFVPNNTGNRKVTGKLTIEPVEIGGDVKTKPESDFEFTLSGEPKMVAHTPDSV